MEFKKTVILIQILLISFFCHSQECGTMALNTTNKERRYYLDSIGYSLLTVDNLLNHVKTKDTHLVKLIIQYGNKLDTEEYFKSIQVSVKKNRFRGFYEITGTTSSFFKKRRKNQPQISKNCKQR
jgi:hypothetical protein